MAGRTGHVYSRSRDRIVSRGPRAVPPAWREQRKERVVSESRVFRSYETRVSSDALPAGMKYTMEDSQGYVCMHALCYTFLSDRDQMQQVTTDIHRVLYLVFRGTIFVENLPPGTTSNDLLVCFCPTLAHSKNICPPVSKI